MNSVLTIGIIISVILGVTSFVASNNYIICIVVLILSILYFVFIAKPIVRKYETKVKRFDECYHFINTFIVSLSIKGSVTSAYESSIQVMSEDFVSSIENIEAFSQKDKLDHINKYFRFHVFSLFVDLINIYEEQGGNILEMSHYLLEETRLIEEYISSSKNITKKKMVEFAILWLLTLGIMVFMRFALSQFFNVIAKQLFYPIGILFICLFCLLSIHIAICKMAKLQIRGWNDAEKI